MKNEINNSIVADKNSTIINAKNAPAININKLKIKHTIIGFIIGVLSELVAIYIYEHFFK